LSFGLTEAGLSVKYTAGSRTQSHERFVCQGKWAITCVSPEGVEAKIKLLNEGRKLLGEWAFGESTGKFELSKSEANF